VHFPLPSNANRRHVLRGIGVLTTAWATAGATAGCAVGIQKGGQAAGAGGAGASQGGASRDAVRIDVDSARAAVQAGRAVLVDVRSPDAYRSQRAAGAVLLPLDEIEQGPAAAAAKLPAGKQAIFYCT
jgi:hypothetical protein